MKMKHTKIVFVVWLLTLLATELGVGTKFCSAQSQGQSKSARPTSFQLYYGGDETIVASVLEKIHPSQIVVVDIRGLSANQLTQLKKQTQKVDAKLIAYISVGELHSRELELFETFAKSQDPNVDFDELKSKVLISENETFSSSHADVLSPVWRKFIFDKADKIMKLGVDGLFLDTVDTADVYARKKEWDLDRRGESVTAMISLVRELKQRDPSRLTLQNRGLNLIGKEVFVGDATGKLIPGLSLDQPHPHNPDVILFEDAFSSTGDWANQMLKKLDSIQQSGEVTVVALGYKDVIQDRDKFNKNCVEHEFIPAWSSNSQSLHLEVAR